MDSLARYTAAMNVLRRLSRSLLRILTAVAAILIGAWALLAQPSCRRNPPSAIQIAPDRLRAHVEKLAGDFRPRDFHHPDQLARCADYMAEHFRQAGATVRFQPFTFAGLPFRNVIARFGNPDGSRVIVGAHYDACGDTPGADDNASGSAALIELAYLLGRNPPARPVELVAYCLEEPPTYQTDSMGSVVHAQSISNEAANVLGVIVLEMVGTFSDEWGSQSYPAPMLHLIYPNRGNFIGVVGRWDHGDWIKTIKIGMKGRTTLPVYSIRAPTLVPGIEMSDHQSYWPLDIPALMITDTAFLRNQDYHTLRDTPDRLDYPAMGRVVVSLYEALCDF